MLCNIFLQKRLPYHFSRPSFLQKTRKGKILSGHFFRRYTFTFFFFIFSYPGLSIGATGVLFIIKLREFEAIFY